MTSPLILLLHERVLPGGQLLPRLQDMGYRVSTLSEPSQLVEQCTLERPLLVMVDLAMKTESVRQAVSALRSTEATRHVPVIAYAPTQNPDLVKPGTTPGATLTVNDSALQLHLQQILDQALHLD